MVEFFDPDVRGKRFFRMTLFAVRTQIGIVRIFVATVAIGEGHAGKSLERLPVLCFLFMALYACYCFMLTQKGEIRF